MNDRPHALASPSKAEMWLACAGRPHALASPSKAEMWLACANSLAANIGQPEGDRKPADLGSDKHELMTLCLQFSVDAMSYDGHVLKFGHTVNKELAADVQTVVDNVRERIAAYELRGAAVEMVLDYAVPIDHITGEQGATGTLDIALLVYLSDDHSCLDVIDAKFGYSEVLAEENPQLLMYASGALEMFGLVEDFTEVNLVIEQPLRGTTEWSTTPEYIEMWAERTRPKAQKAILIHNMVGERALKSEEFGVSEKGCMWCKAKAVCPAAQAKVEEIMRMGFETLDPEELVGEVKPMIDLIPVDKLGEVFPSLEFIEDWIKGIRARVELELLAGKQIPGLKLVAGKKGNRTWASDEEAEAMMKKFKMKQDQMYSFKLLGPKPILEALADQPRRLKQIESLIVQPAGKPHVALDSDKRPALEIKPVEDGFDTIEDLC
jgi:Protein of unknown function (DUF2800)